MAGRPLAAAAGLAALAVVGVVGCSGGSDSNHQTCGLVHDVVTELGKKHPHANVVKAKLGEIRRAARDAKDAQLRRLAPNLTPPSSTASDKAAGPAPLVFTTAGVLAALQERCGAYSSTSPRAPPTSGKTAPSAARGAEPPA
ncbi:MAG TPA: hypothetical protein VKH36_08065 [Acidimicrobiia bacterium]|nr:hypothetical protein [Acidimicrobiia bacterium]